MAELTDKQRHAVKLLAFKAENGLTNAEIAKEVGVSTRTLYNWKNARAFQAELSELSEIIMKTFLTETYQALRRIIISDTARDSDKINAIKLALRQQGKMNNKKEHDVQFEQLDVVAVLEQLEADRNL